MDGEDRASEVRRRKEEARRRQEWLSKFEQRYLHVDAVSFTHGNVRLDARDTLNIKVKVSNKGPGTVTKVAARLERPGLWKGNTPWHGLPDIPPGEEVDASWVVTDKRYASPRWQAALRNSDYTFALRFTTSHRKSFFMYSHATQVLES